MRWEEVRDQLAQAFGEAQTALASCQNEADFGVVFAIVERYAEVARDSVRAGSSTRRLEAMRAAVDTMRGAVDPTKPRK